MILFGDKYDAIFTYCEKRMKLHTMIKLYEYFLFKNILLIDFYTSVINLKHKHFLWLKTAWISQKWLIKYSSSSSYTHTLKILKAHDNENEKIK